MSKPVVGFIGLGIMGLPMAGHVLAAGYPLVVFNRTREKTLNLQQKGAAVADSPRDLAGRSDVIITIVSDSPDVEEVVAGSEGVIHGIRPGTVVVDMSTVAPALEKRLDELLRGKGCSLVDAPVSGGDTGARSATLAIMAGGTREDFERVRPVLETMGKTITWCGACGAGQLTKLCNQILVSVNLLAVCEALLFADRNALDLPTMIQAVSGGAAGSWQLSNLGPRIVERDFDPGFMIDLMQKDLRLVFETADSTHTPLPGTALVRQFFHSEQAVGRGQDGTQALARVLQTLAAGGSV